MKALSGLTPTKIMYKQHGNASQKTNKYVVLAAGDEFISNVTTQLTTVVFDVFC